MALPKEKYLGEEEVCSEECKQLLQTLPKDKGWICNSLYQYNGFWHSSRQIQGILNCDSHFHALPSDILLVTTPKSGTTWLKALLFSLVNRHNHEPGQPHHPLTVHNPHELVPFLDIVLFPDINQIPDLSGLPSPRLFSAHIPFPSLPSSVPSSACKIVYLCRDPRDTFVSLWHFANKLNPSNPPQLEEAFERFCKGVSGYGPYWDHVLGYWNESLKKDSKVLFLKYEDVKGDTVFYVKRLAEFLGCPFSPEEDKEGVVDGIIRTCSFDVLSQLEVNRCGKLDTGEENKVFFRCGEVGDWANYMTPEMVERLKSIIQDKLCDSGLCFF